MNQDTIKQAIQGGRTKEAIELFKTRKLSTLDSNTLSIIEAEFNTLNDESLKGLLDAPQKQRRLNHINDRLLGLLSKKAGAKTSKSPVALILLVGLLFLALSTYFIRSNSSINCPDFDNKARHQILLVPFQNVGGATAKPHLLLRDRIETLVLKNQLSTSIKATVDLIDIPISEAAAIARSCGANVIVWGKYAHSDDSLSLILQYHFLDQPDWSKTEDAITVKDATSIQSGTISKNLEDSIFLLCSIIALRQNELELTQKWLDKITDKDESVEEVAQIVERLSD